VTVNGRWSCDFLHLPDNGVPPGTAAAPAAAHLRPPPDGSRRARLRLARHHKALPASGIRRC